MATVQDIIHRAYRKIGVVAHDDAMTSDQAAVGLDAFNDMMAGFELDGISPSSLDLTIADDFPMEAKFREGIVYLLASRLAPDWAVPVGFDADAFLRRMQADYMIIETVPLDRELVRRSVT